MLSICIVTKIPNVWCYADICLLESWFLWLEELINSKHPYLTKLFGSISRRCRNKLPTLKHPFINSAHCCKFIQTCSKFSNWLKQWTNINFSKLCRIIYFIKLRPKACFQQFEQPQLNHMKQNCVRFHQIVEYLLWWGTIFPPIRGRKLKEEGSRI